MRECEFVESFLEIGISTGYQRMHLGVEWMDDVFFYLNFLPYGRLSGHRWHFAAPMVSLALDEGVMVPTHVSAILVIKLFV